MVGRRILVTGMSGTGKSAALRELHARGHRVVDADGDEWSYWGTLPDGSVDWVWREREMADLLSGHRDGVLFVAGCAPNQGRFYPRFDAVVLLSAPAEVMLDRIARRGDNPFGKAPEERAKILQDLATVEPLLRRGATTEIDTTACLSDVVRQLEGLAGP